MKLFEKVQINVDIGKDIMSKIKMHFLLPSISTAIPPNKAAIP